MTKQSQNFVIDQEVEKAQNEYRDSLSELRDLEDEKKKIIAGYIHDLEEQKIQQLRSSI